LYPAQLKRLDWYELGAARQRDSGQLGIPAAPFADYARWPQTVTEPGAVALGLRFASKSDLPMTIEEATKAAENTDRGQPITLAIVAELRAAKSGRVVD
jgi:hypothetical protein